MMARLLEGAPSETQARRPPPTRPSPRCSAARTRSTRSSPAARRCRPTARACRGTAATSSPAATCSPTSALNVAAEAQGRLQTSRIYEHDRRPGGPGDAEFLLARDTRHQNQWLLGIEQPGGRVHRRSRGLAAATRRTTENARTFYNFTEGSTAGEGRWAQGTTLVGGRGDRSSRRGCRQRRHRPGPRARPGAVRDLRRQHGRGQPGMAGGWRAPRVSRTCGEQGQGRHRRLGRLSHFRSQHDPAS